MHPLFVRTDDGDAMSGVGQFPCRDTACGRLRTNHSRRTYVRLKPTRPAVPDFRRDPDGAQPGPLTALDALGPRTSGEAARGSGVGAPRQAADAARGSG